MKKIVFLISLVMILSIPAVSFAAINSGGGQWEQGSTPINVWSHYYHKSKTHRSTACAGSKSNCATSSWVNKGVWSNAERGKLPWETGLTFYDVK